MYTSLNMWSTLFCIYLCLSGVSPQTPNREERYNFFNIDLLQAINEEIAGNVVISPASAKIALTTLLEGTGGRTQQELLTTLRLPSDISEIRSVIKRNLTPLKRSINGTDIDVATQLWAANGLLLINRYVHAIQEFYRADVRFLNFGDMNNAVNTINQWVRQATRNKIQSLVEPGGLSADTRLLLTSALYFKGQWLNSFDKNITKLRCFYTASNQCRKVPFMENIAKYRYAYVDSLDAEVVEIPYSDRKTSMLILLPKNEANDRYLQILSKDLSYVPMSALLASLEETEVQLILPKFNIESKLDLRSTLMRMGIRDIFDISANLSMISPEQRLHVSNVLQNAKIEVDEQGTIAAAVTGLSIAPLMGITTQMFTVDRPFIFAIVDLDTKGTLFAGRLMDPTLP